MDDFSLTEEELKELSAYSQLPERLRIKCEQNGKGVDCDVFGVRDRFSAIKQNFQGKSLGSVLDLGCCSGFFSLSMLDSGMASNATMYDITDSSLVFGRKIAKALHIENKAVFEKEKIDLDFVRALQPVDTVICLNLIHHAGVLFDVEIVQSIGWAEYARQWMLALKEKANILIIGVGLKGEKPVNWNVPHFDRALEFVKIAESAGWKMSYDANVSDIRKYGVAKANGRHSRGMRLGARIDFLQRQIRQKFHLKNSGEKLSKYHLFIMEL